METNETTAVPRKPGTFLLLPGGCLQLQAGCKPLAVPGTCLLLPLFAEPAWPCRAWHPSACLTNVVGAVPGHLYKSSSPCSCSPRIPLLPSNKAFPKPGDLQLWWCFMQPFHRLSREVFTACLWAGKHWVFLMHLIDRHFSCLKDHE